MAEQGEPRALELSRYCVPFTPFQGRLEDVAVRLVHPERMPDRRRDERPPEWK